MVWWYWLNGALYHDLHGNNDIRTRVFTFLQMISVVGMAIFANEAFHSGAKGFTISAISLLLILLFLWWRVGYHHKKLKPLSNFYAIFLILNIALLSGSLALKPPLNHLLWLLTITISFFLPILTSSFSFYNPKVKIEQTTQASASLVERFGLFNIIVLGEIITAVVSGSGYVEFDIKVAGLCFFGILMAIGIWWLYYDFISHRKPRKGTVYFILWYYLHLPLTAGITGIGASILYSLKHANEDLSSSAHYLFLSSMATVCFCIALLYSILETHSETSKYFIDHSRSLLIVSCIYIALLFVEIDIILLFALGALLLFIPILYLIIKNHFNMQQTD